MQDDPGMSITSEVEERVRRRGVRVEERLALLRRLVEGGDSGEEELRRRIAELEQRIRDAAKRVRGALR